MLFDRPGSRPGSRLSSRIGSVALLAGLLALFAGSAGVTTAAAAPTRARPNPTAVAKQKRVIVFVGLPGSGKSTYAKRLAARLGTKKLSTGDAIRATIAARGLPYTPENDRAVAEELANPPGGIARRVADQVDADPSTVAVVEGFRTTADLAAFRERFPQATVVSIEVGRERRFDRMLKRGRAGEDNRAFLLGRDRSEVRRGVREVMRQADLRLRPRDDGDASIDRALDRVLRTAEARAAAAE